VLTIDGAPFFPAVECAEKLGYRKPHDAVSRHCRASVKRGVIDSLGRTQEKIYIPEGDLYRLIIRSKLPAAARFEAWVFDEVLTSIRKYGAYITEEALRKLRESNDYSEDLFRQLSAEQAKSNSLMEYVEKAAPKARYYDVILQCRGPVQVSIIAKDYGMTAIAFNKLLHKLGVQYKIGGTWLLYKDFSNKGYTVTKTYYIDGVIASIHTCWTQKGRRFIYEALKSCGILPEAEKMMKAAAN